MSKPPKTPQEKKALSLKKDCRPSYGNNVKAARRLVPLRKAQEHRRARHRANQDVAVLDRLGEEASELAESSARQDTHSLGGWTKGPDIRLGEIVSRIPEMRAAKVGAKAQRREKQARFQTWLEERLTDVPENAP